MLRHEAEDEDGLLLPDTVRAVLRLQVHLRVPVLVEENDSVRSNEIDAETSGAGAEEEEVGRIGPSTVIELVHLQPAVLLLRAAVDAAHFEALEERRPVLDDVKHCCELREQKHLVTLGEEGVEETVQQ